MFDSLKKNLATAASAANAGMNTAMTAAKDRLDTAQAGKKMLDEGGEPMAAKLLAKKASTDTVWYDAKLMIDLKCAMGSYTVAKQSMQDALEHSADESPPFAALANDYAARAESFKTCVEKLQFSMPSKPTVSAAEKDGIAIAVAKKSVGGARKSITSLLGGGAAQEPEATNAPAGSSTAGEASQAVGNWLSNAANTTKERVTTAMPGKTMVDEGGEPMIAKLLAKKASVDATSFDERVVTLLSKLIESYSDAAAKLRESAAFAEGESPAFDMLAAEYDARSADMKGVLDRLPPAPAPASVSTTEKNAIIYMVAHIKVRDAKTKVMGTVQEVQARAVEAAAGTALSSATGGAVSSVPEGTGRVAVQVAKENPELAKAAMGAATNAAARPP